MTSKKAKKSLYLVKHTLKYYLVEKLTFESQSQLVK